MMLWPFIALVLLLLARFGLDPLLKGHEPTAYVEPSEHVLAIAIIVVLSLVIDALLRKFYWHDYLQRRRNRETPSLIQDIVTITLILIGLSIGLWWQAGLTLTGIAAASGAVAFVLGIALQPVIQDLFSGLSINFEGSYTLGDWITVYSGDLEGPVYGRVSGITWRATFLTLENETRLMVPNSMMTTKPVLNHSKPMTPKQLSVEVELDNRLPADRALDMLMGEALKATRHPGIVRTPAPYIVLRALDKDSLYYEVRFFVNPHQIMPGPAKSLMLRALHDVIQQNELPLPVAQVELVKAPDLEYLLGEEEIFDALSMVDIFQTALEKDQVRALAKGCKAAELAAGSVLMRQGDSASSMFVILEGAAAISVPDPKGGAHEVAISATGDVAGEMSLLTGAPRSATVTALTRLRVVEITKESLEELLKRTPELLESFSRILAQRQHELDEHANRQSNVKKTETDLLARMKAAFSGLFRR